MPSGVYVRKGHSHNWKGGRVITSHGYVVLRMPDHPRAMANGYVYEHILVSEIKLGRPLLPGEIVHHKDENRQNNAEENLIITGSIGEHKLNHRVRQDLRLPGEVNPKIFCECGCGEKFLKYDENGRPRRYTNRKEPSGQKVCHHRTGHGLHLGGLVSMIYGIKPDFVTIGADSKGHNLVEPPWEKVQELINTISKFTEIRQKSNLERLRK